MIPLEGTVAYLRCVATVAVSLAVSIQYMHECDRQTPHDGIGPADA